jgi:hypothetical protein
MAEPLRRRIWAERLTWIALALSIGAVIVALIAALGTGQGAWHYRTAFTILRLTFYAAVAGGLTAIIAFFLARRFSGKLQLRNLLAFGIALLFAAYLGNLVATARSVPPIHDITTNLDDPPRFYRLKVRADNLENVPHDGRAELRALPAEERWRTLHREGYGDLRTIRVPWSVAETIRRAEELARDRGWEFATISADGGVLEATDTTMFFRFKDDIVVRARPAPGGGTLVDMRSISRVGVSDVGANAKRIRAFLRDLQQS